MPVARGPQINARSAIAVGIAGVVFALLLGAGVIWLAGSGSNVKIQLGDTDFDAGAPNPISKEIADNGPLLYSDVGGGARDIILNHLGNDPQTGWFSFAARPTDQPRTCFFEWNAAKGLFELTSADESTSCSDTTADATGVGDGVLRYPVRIGSNGSVRVDINLISQKTEEGQ